MYNKKFKILFTSLIIMILLSSVSNNLYGVEVNDWENPTMLGQNKEPPHCTLIPYSNHEKAERGESRRA